MGRDSSTRGKYSTEEDRKVESTQRARGQKASGGMQAMYGKKAKVKRSKQSHKKRTSTKQ